MAFNRFVEKEKNRVAFKFSLIHHSIRLAIPIFPLQSRPFPVSLPTRVSAINFTGRFVPRERRTRTEESRGIIPCCAVINTTDELILGEKIAELARQPVAIISFAITAQNGKRRRAFARFFGVLLPIISRETVAERRRRSAAKENDKELLFAARLVLLTDFRPGAALGTTLPVLRTTDEFLRPESPLIRIPFSIYTFSPGLSFLSKCSSEELTFEQQRIFFVSISSEVNF